MADALERADYWTRRKHLMYFKYVDVMVRAIGRDATSIIDIGSKNCGYLDWFYWIDDKASLDLNEPYSAPGVRSIQANLFDWQPDKLYDVALCLQVMEHVPDVQAFGAKLLSVARHVIISVPYKWREDAAATHVHDPIDRSKFRSWFSVRPNYEVVVPEPLGGSHSRRLVAYFNTAQPGVRGFAEMRRNMRPPRPV